LRAIGGADWPSIVARSSRLMGLMLQAPSFSTDATSTRDQTLHAIEALARKARRSEVAVADALLLLMRAPQAVTEPVGLGDAGVSGVALSGVAAYWLQGAGRPQLAKALGLRHDRAWLLRCWAKRLATSAYLGSLALGTAALLWWVWRSSGGLLQPTVFHALAVVLALLPASEAVVAVINRLISESARPVHLPRLDFATGIPPAHRVLVAIPSMLTSAAAVQAAVHRLHLHYLANREEAAQFVLLSDWADAPQQRMPQDQALLDQACEALRALNLQYPRTGDHPRTQRFTLLHRERRYSQGEQAWIGWERKRGKLQTLLAAMAAPALPASNPGQEATAPAGFIDLGDLCWLAPNTPYLVTLDSDTELPPGRLRELVSIAAHPQNHPQLDATGRVVQRGWGILQPRVATPLPDRPTPFHWLFAGQCGIDPYSAASSEVYQDLFGEGSFSGKGLLHVQAVHAVLGQCLPDNQVLSHDLLEGSLARCAVATDVTVLEDAPFHADVAASRLHRWTRGDWQLLPFLLQPRRYPLRAINRWKMVDNLRRSLVAPASLALLVLALLAPSLLLPVGQAVGLALSPIGVLVLVLAAFTAGPLMGAVAGLAPSHDDIAKRPFYAQAGAELARALGGGLWHLSQLLAHALMSLDAIARALWRTLVSRRHLLQWTTAAAAQAAAQHRLAGVLRVHWFEPLAAAVLAVVLWASGTPHLALGLGLCTLWALAPVLTWWASRESAASGSGQRDPPVSAANLAKLEGVARDSWRFFERCVGPQDLYLPPDNLQTDPYDMVAHRTSPTNIGLYLLSAACARQFGWIGTQDLLQRLEATLATLDKLERSHGHFLNWYDTQTGAALLPRYVSSVDSGNLSGHLLAVAQACKEFAAHLAAPSAAQAPAFLDSNARALAAAHQRLAPLLARFPQVLESLAPAGNSAWKQLFALTQNGWPHTKGQAPVAESISDASMADLLQRATDELMLSWPPAALAPRAEPGPAAPNTQEAQPVSLAAPLARECLVWQLADYLATVRSVWLDVQAHAQAPEREPHSTFSRLTAIAQRCETLAWQPDFACLYHPRRRLLHLGLRVAEQELDTGMYDLLASESRLTSLLAIAKADVPVAHWAALGRPFHAVGSQVALRSWSGSMFEYLMPGLVLAEPTGSVLHSACQAAVLEHIQFGRLQRLPWGVSESAYAGRDSSLAYQYAPQGVPRLALRRTPPQDRVVAPYATVMASQVAPICALANLHLLAALGARQRYGYIEALDYSASRLAGNAEFTPVSTFMAHHQGMSIVALANVCLGGVAQRWGMASPQLQAVASLLHERPPREVPARVDVPANLPPAASLALQNRAPGHLREVLPGSQAVEPTHVLGNGSYSVTLRANGAGTSRWRGLGINRSRDDALRDALGSFFYLRMPGREAPVSITQHPAPDRKAHYSSNFHADRVCFDAAWAHLRAHTTVWVSPEDDVEFRQIDLYNSGEQDLDLELISAFEVSLADPRADEAHPAFSKLFVSAHWRPASQALVFERRPRQSSETALCMAHFLVSCDVPVQSLRVQTDRALWWGRNQGASQVRARFQDLPLADSTTEPGAAAGTATALVLNTGLDPMCAMSVRLRLKQQSQMRLTFATAATPHGDTLTAVIDKYRQTSHVQRASMMSATLMGIRLRNMNISVPNFAALQSLTTALLFTLTRQGALLDPAAGCDRRLLWRFGLSGDRPILLVTVATEQGLALLRSLTQALRLWSWGGIACDLVVVNAEATSYDMPVQREAAALRDRHASEAQAEQGAAPPDGSAAPAAQVAAAAAAAPSTTGLFLLRAQELSAAELATLQSLARVHLQADGRPLSRHVWAWLGAHDTSHQQRHNTSTTAVPVVSAPGVVATQPQGEFEADSGAFGFNVHSLARPQRPWVNVLANPGFGCHVSEAGGGHTWALNSRLNQITAWANDPVADPASDTWLLQDTRSGAVWSLVPSAHADPHSRYHVQHGQGSTRISHRVRRVGGNAGGTAGINVGSDVASNTRSDVQVVVTWCVDAVSAVKQVHVQIDNHGARSLHWRLIGLVEWQMGATRADRAATVSSRVHSRPLNALLATQQDHSAGFGGGTAFFVRVDAAVDSDRNSDKNSDKNSGAEDSYDATEKNSAADMGDWTCDRREFFDARGRLVVPDHLGQRSGAGLDPCAALATRMRVAAGASSEHTFLLGYATSASAAIELAKAAAAVAPAQRLKQAQAQWDSLLNATEVQTPDPLFDALVNRWLLYQTVSCRLWAKAGFYQAGGATGFRDQLQDTLALSWAAPQLLRAQIVLCASRQFVQGDVQHWWHAPSGAGVRTHFSDDLLWLPWACVHYLSASGDAAVLDETVPFLEGGAIAAGAEDAYDTPTISNQLATVYEHAARTLDRSLATGVHGLPLMGSGDWNDGMNRVGAQGRGESVWLAWFLCKLVAGFAPIAQARGDTARAGQWLQAATGWALALQGDPWDGSWYKRAYFDDGSSLGASANAEARIDLIAQAWSVLAAVAPADREKARQAQAMQAVQQNLVDSEAGLIRLLHPPLQNASPSAGYIQAYPPGVRENGGQYSHGAVWALMAQAELVRQGTHSVEAADLPYRYFTYLSPAHRAQHPQWGAVYGLEPYVMAGDICSQPPHTGRGGWSWYTGAAAWMHRAAVESIFGLSITAQDLCFWPALPSHWPQAQITLRRDGRRMQFTLHRGTEQEAVLATRNARVLRVGEKLLWPALAADSSFVIALPQQQA
jgi:cyclic beta-1,2-glucan synthetase